MEILYRAPAAADALAARNTKFYELIADGLVPPGVRVGSRTVAWPASEIAAVQRAFISGMDIQAHRGLVQSLIAQRTASDDL